MAVIRHITNTGDPILGADGAPKVGVAITFQLVDAAKRQPVVLFDAAAEGGDLIVGDLVTATTDVDGQFAVDLWPNNRGEVATLYKVRLPDGVAGGPAKPFYIRVTEGEGDLTLLAAKTAMEALQPQTLSLFDALLANIISIVNTATAPATTTENGLMAFADKTKLDRIYTAEAYASLQAAVATLGVTEATLNFYTDQALTANLTIPANIELVPMNGAKIIHGAYTVSYAGSTLRWPLAQIFEGAGVVSLPSAPVGYPQWFTTADAIGTNAGPAIQKALNTCSRVELVAGVYPCTIIRLNSNNELYGAGNATVLRSFDSTTASQYVLATNAYGEGTDDPTENKHDIYVHDLKLDGRMQEFGYQPFFHVMTINATSDMLVERVTIYDNRGDGCYLGSGTNNGIERHNQRITFRDCTFDGVSKNNRNGLAVIDCDGLTVENCNFRNIGNATLSSSVGAIDFEPNSTYNVYRNIKIIASTFTDIDSVNTAAISFFNSNQSGDGRNIRDWLVDGCTFTRCYRAISTSTVAKTPNSVSDNLTVINSKFLNSTVEDIAAGGLNGVVIGNNNFEVSPVGSTSYRGGIIVGQTAAGVCLNGVNFKIIKNTFVGIRPQFGAVALKGARGADILSNSFVNITGACISALNVATAGTGRYLEGIRAMGNELQTPFDTFVGAHPTTGLFVNTAGIGTEFISSTCIERDNTVMGRALKHRVTSLVAFQGQELTAAPTTGTWEVGNIVTLAGAYGGTFTCSVAGTFGALAGVTADATNGSYALTGVVDTSTALREGHWITVGAGATAYKVAKIEGTTVYLKPAFTGTTGAGLAVAFVTPEFTYTAPMSVSADKGNAAATLGVGTAQMVNVWATPLTADRAVAISTTNAVRGAKFRVVRTATATGAYNLNVGTGPLKALTAGTWCDVEHNGTGWILTASGSL